MALSRAQYEEALRILSMRRQDAAVRSNTNKEALYEALPEARRLDDEMRDLALRETVAGLKGRPDEAERLKSLREELIDKRNKLVGEAGYPADYDRVSYSCGRCRDTGYVDNVKCGCLKEIESRILLRDSLLPEYMTGGGLGEVETLIYDDTEPLKELKPKLMTQSAYVRSFILPGLNRFLKDFDSGGKRSILMYGPAGTGKTFLAARLARDLIGRQHQVIYERAGEMFGLLSKAQFSSREVPGARELEAGLKDAEVLILDDLGTEFSTEFTRARLYSLIADRLSGGQATVITTNMSLKGLKELYSERVSSRLMGGYLIMPFYGRDLRILKGEK